MKKIFTASLVTAVGIFCLSLVCSAETLLLGSNSFKNFNIGDGVTEEGERRASIFSDALVDKKPINVGQTFYEFKFVESIEEANEMLSASLSGKTRFGIASGSAKAQFSHSSNITANSSILMIHAVRTISSDSIPSSTLNKAIQAYAIKPIPDVRDFVMSYGNKFVNQVLYGSEYYALAIISNSNSQEKTDLQAQLNFKSVVTSIKGDIETKIEKELSQKSITIQEIESGSTREASTSIDQLISKLKSFNSNHPVQVAVDVLPYSVINRKLPGPLSKSNEFQVQNMNVQVSNLKTKLSKINDILNYPDSFVVTPQNLDLLSKTRTKLTQQFSMLEARLFNCNNTNICQPLNLSNISFVYPKRKKLGAPMLFSVQSNPKDVPEMPDPNISILWNKTPIYLEVGDQIEIKYLSGKWQMTTNIDMHIPQNDINGLSVEDSNKFLLPPLAVTPVLYGAPIGSLVGKIGNQVFHVKENVLQYTASKEGFLQFAANDHLSHYWDNEGFLILEIKQLTH